MSSSCMISAGIISCNACTSWSTMTGILSGKYKCGVSRVVCVFLHGSSNVRNSMVVMEHAVALNTRPAPKSISA